MSDSRLGQRIGAGRRAEIYTWKDDQVVKLMQKGFEGDAEREIKTLQVVFDAGLPVPAVESLLEIDGRLGIIMERIPGPTMIDVIENKPWQCTHLGRVLADLHTQVHSCETGALPSQRDDLQKRVNNDAGLAQDMKDALLESLHRLPDGNSICHGDFNPGNIIMSPRGPVIIDWADARRGHPLADIARTWLLARIAVLPVEYSLVIRLLARVVRMPLWSAYLKQYRQLYPFSLEELEDWKLLKAYERLPEVPEERERLISFIKSRLPKQDYPR